MWKDAALITVSCVLFIQMGLSEAIQKVLHIRIQIISCPKCLTMWTNLTFLILSKNRILDAVAVSFLFAYIALWLALLYDSIAVLYNMCYEKITPTQDTPSAEADGVS